jgi:hypothetical protein
VVSEADGKALVVSNDEYNRQHLLIFSKAGSGKPMDVAMGLHQAMQLASRCWDAQKFYANECERLKAELATRPQGEK